MSTMPPPGNTPPPGNMPPPPGNPGQPVGGVPQPMGPKPDNYLVWAILTTVFCCLPFGIVSIVFAAKVDGLYASGQYAEAQVAAGSAKKWAIVAGVVGLIAAAVWGILYFTIFAVAVNSGYQTY